MLRIAITGPESSGKTSLAIEIAAHFGSSYVPEFARFYLQNRAFNYTVADLEHISRSQVEWFERSARIKAPLLIQDSDFAVMHVWMEERFKQCSLEIEAMRRSMHFNHYLLCAPDLPWSFDPLRENPNDRWRLFERYVAVLQAWGLPYTIVEGEGQPRINMALAKISGLLLNPASSKA
jgi:nicotinamide riboside kinase